jgi:hypothetical protein
VLFQTIDRHNTILSPEKMVNMAKFGPGINFKFMVPAESLWTGLTIVAAGATVGPEKLI